MIKWIKYDFYQNKKSEKEYKKMRKGLKNQKVVSAVLVGISAMMALSTPMTAYASEGDIHPFDDGNTEDHAVTPEVTESHMADSVQEVAETASESVESAETVVDTVADQIIEEVAVLLVRY